jgi:methionine biosynthesis protein MetW
MSQQVQDLNKRYVHKFATAMPVLRAQKRLLSMIGMGRKVLDVGCGSGHYTSQFRDLGNEVTGIDITQEGVLAVRALGIPAYVANVEQGLPFADRTFDAVTCIEVVEHLLRPDLAIREIHRVMKPGTALILTTPNYAYWALRLLYLFGRPPVGLQSRPYTGFRSRQPAEGIDAWLDPHIRFFTPGTIRSLLSRFGFTVEQLRSTFVAFPSGLAPYIPFLPGLPLRVIGKLIGNLEFLGDRLPSLLAAGIMVKALKT